jgi:hypothetical protein
MIKQLAYQYNTSAAYLHGAAKVINPPETSEYGKDGNHYPNLR